MAEKKRIRKKSIVIQSSTFRLESFNEKYITEEYVGWLKNKEIGRQIVHAHPSVTLNDVRDYCIKLINSKNNYFLAIIMNEGNKHIGNVRLDLLITIN